MGAKISGEIAEYMGKSRVVVEENSPLELINGFRILKGQAKCLTLIFKLYSIVS
jgi:hypothetical protein